MKHDRIYFILLFCHLTSSVSVWRHGLGERKSVLTTVKKINSSPAETSALVHTLSSTTLVRHLTVDSESIWKILPKCLETIVFTISHSCCKRELWNILTSKKIKWNPYCKGGDGEKYSRPSHFDEWATVVTNGHPVKAQHMQPVSRGFHCS